MTQTVNLHEWYDLVVCCRGSVTIDVAKSIGLRGSVQNVQVIISVLWCFHDVIYAVRVWLVVGLKLMAFSLTVKSPLVEKNKVPTGWTVAAVRSSLLWSHCLICDFVVFTLACCEWDWGGGGDEDPACAHILFLLAPIQQPAIPDCLTAVFPRVVIY